MQFKLKFRTQKFPVQNPALWNKWLTIKNESYLVLQQNSFFLFMPLDLFQIKDAEWK